jgi:hypothetical protein
MEKYEQEKSRIIGAICQYFFGDLKKNVKLASEKSM